MILEDDEVNIPSVEVVVVPISVDAGSDSTTELNKPIDPLNQIHSMI